MTEVHAVPVPIIKGRFNVYDTPDGGYHIAYVRDGEDEIQHMTIPGMLINAAKMMESGKLSPLQAFKFLKGGTNVLSATAVSLRQRLICPELHDRGELHIARRGTRSAMPGMHRSHRIS